MKHRKLVLVGAAATTALTLVPVTAADAQTASAQGSGAPASSLMSEPPNAPASIGTARPVGGTVAQTSDAPSSPAQSSSNASSTTNDVIVTGTRQTGVRAADSAAPIQVVGSGALTRTGSTDLASSLSVNVPSLNIQTIGGDLAGLTVIAALRGLSPNDTLILIDGKRRHTTSNLAVNSGFAYSGAATTDLAFIPVDAIDHVEVLTDGAAAQYGTDAIAGVVNVILKKSNHGGLLSGTAGQYYTSHGGGDGKTGTLSINKGFNLGDRGYVNVTLEHRYHNYTIFGIGDVRAQNPDGSPLASLTFPDTNVTKAARFPYENGAIGDPEFRISNGLVTAGYKLSDNVEAYANASVGSRVAYHLQYYRLPSKVSGVTSAGQTVYPFPYGFDPREKINETDYSITGGLRGTAAGWHFDLSSTYGSDKNVIHVVDSANPLLYQLLQAQSPTPIQPQTDFYNGRFEATQFTNTLDIDRGFDVGLASPLNVAFGGEIRHETYSIGAGEPSALYGTGVQSFAAYSPLDASKNGRTNYAGYLDLAADLVRGLHVDAAGRFEHYTDFGNATVGKLTARYDFSPAFAVRGTVATGFRAPTLAEEFYSGTNTTPFYAIVQPPSNGRAAQLAGFNRLKPEKSTNYSVGFVAHPVPRLQITADFYQINLRDRIFPSGYLVGNSGNTIVSQAVLNAIAAQGVTLESGLSYTAISVFTNAVDTRTRGAEITASYASDFGGLGHIDWSAGFNYNDTALRKVVALPTGVTNAAFGQTTFLDLASSSALTSATPKAKGVAQAYWTLGKLNVNLRETVYGKTAQWTLDSSYYQRIGTTAITDLEVGYRITPSIKFAVGANNLFDKKPPTLPVVNGVPAGPFPEFRIPYIFAPWGANGGYYYGRLSLSF